MKPWKASCRARSAGPLRIFAVISLIFAVLYLAGDAVTCAAWLQHGSGIGGMLKSMWFELLDAFMMAVIAVGALQLLRTGVSKAYPLGLLLNCILYALSLAGEAVILAQGGMVSRLYIAVRLFGLAILILLVLYTQNRFSRETAVVLSVLNLVGLVYAFYSYLAYFGSSPSLFYTVCDGVNMAATACKYLLIILLTVLFERKAD